MSLEAARARIDECNINSSRLYLSALSLDNKELLALKPEIEKLENLTELSLDGNRISDITPLRGMTGLTKLYLGGNEISDITPLRGMTRLTKLSLGGNGISDITPLKEITGLTTLYLNDNEISDITPLKGMTGLTGLYLERNPITSLPPELVQLTNLKILWLTKNKTLLKIIPDKALFFDPVETNREIDAQAILKSVAEYHALKLTKEDALLPFNEAKLILLGNGNAGKTSLRRCLKDGTGFDPAEPSTRFFEVDDVTLPVNKKDFRLNVYDFGGQEIYHSQHRFFFSERCIYVIVVNMRSGNLDHHDLGRWLNTVAELSKDNEDNPAPTLIVATHCEDDHSPIPKLDREKISALESAKSEAKRFSFVADVIGVSCSKYLQIDEVKNGLSEMLSGLLEDIQRADGLKGEPQRWRDARAEIRKRSENYISTDELSSAFATPPLSLKLEEHATVEYLLKWAGVITPLIDQRSGRYFLLNQRWITKAVGRVLTYYQLSETQGELNEKELRDYLRDKGYDETDIDIVIQQMCNIRLCHQNGDKFFFPTWYLASVTGKPKFEPNTSLFFKFKFDKTFPMYLINSFIIEGRNSYRKGTFWRSGLWFSEDKCTVLIESDPLNQEITVKISGEESRFDKFLQQIRDWRRRAPERIEPQELIAVRGFPKKRAADGAIEDNLIEYNEIQNARLLNADQYYVKNGQGEQVQRSPAYLLWQEHAKPSLPKTPDRYTKNQLDLSRLLELVQLKGKIDEKVEHAITWYRVIVIILAAAVLYFVFFLYWVGELTKWQQSVPGILIAFVLVFGEKMVKLLFRKEPLDFLKEWRRKKLREKYKTELEELTRLQNSLISTS